MWASKDLVIRILSSLGICFVLSLPIVFSSLFLAKLLCLIVFSIAFIEVIHLFRDRFIKKFEYVLLLHFIAVLCSTLFFGNLFLSLALFGFVPFLVLVCSFFEEDPRLLLTPYLLCLFYLGIPALLASKLLQKPETSVCLLFLFYLSLFLIVSLI